MKMKKRLIAATLFYALGASAETKPMYDIKFSGDLEYSGFCKAVLSNDVNLLKRHIRSKVGVIATNEKGVLERLVKQNGMRCNGADLISFSIQRQAPEVQAYLSQAD
jgi:hypothetical protein